MAYQGDPLRVFLGYDKREDIAYEVAKHSIVRLASVPVLVERLDQDALRRCGLYRRGAALAPDGHLVDRFDGKPFSTDFAFSRFLVPALTQYRGWALFADSDILVVDDLCDLFVHADSRSAAMVVKHTHRPTETIKMDGRHQQIYPRKNWSSVILWNCEHPANRTLMPDVVSTAPGEWLHGFRWLADEDIGELPEKWNWLEGWSSPLVEPSIVHYTRGGPWFPNCQNVAYADRWRTERALMRKMQQCGS
jgi:hypothetical protein